MLERRGKMRRHIYINPTVKKIITIAVVELFPAVIALVLTLTLSNFLYFHYIYALFAIVMFLFALIRNWRRDTKNYKKQHSIVEDPKTEDFKEYKRFQRTLWILGAVNVAISYLFWFIYLWTK